MSTQFPLISIICTAHNHEKFVVKAFESVMKQTYQNIELIIVDNGSDDGSCIKIEEWLKGKQSIKFIKNKENIGITKSFNQATKFATGEYLMDLSADDELLPNCIGQLVNNAIENTDAAIVFGNCNVIDENNSYIETYFELLDNQIRDKTICNLEYRRILEGGICICSVSSIFKKETFDEIGGYDEDLDYEDLDFWIRISRNHKISYLDEIVVLKRKLSNSISQHFYKKSTLDLNKSTLKILKKAFKLNQTKQEHLALLKRVHNTIILNYKIKKFNNLLHGLILKVKIHFHIRFLSNN